MTKYRKPICVCKIRKLPRNLEKVAAGFEKDLRKIFDLQRKELHRVLKARDAYSRLKPVEKKISAADINFVESLVEGVDFKAIADKSQEAFKKWYKKASNISGDAALKTIGIHLAFNLKNKGMLKAFKSRGAKITGNISERTLRNFRNIMRKAYEEEGISPYDLRNKIDGLFEETYKNRAFTIARFETGTCQTQVQNQAYIRNGIRKKTWLSIGDERTRQSHLDINGTTVGMEEPFVLDGVKGDKVELMFPLDPDGPPEEIINCFDELTEVLTENGFINLKDLSGAEMIATINISTMEMSYEKPLRLIASKYNGKMIGIRNQSMDFLMTPNHNLIVYDKWQKENGIKKIKFKRADKLSSQETVPKNGTIWKGDDSDKINLWREGLDSKKALEFMGWYLSEGSISKPKSGVWQIKISQSKFKNTDKYNSIENLARSLFDKVWCGKEEMYIPLYNKEESYFLQFGKSYEKYIPENIKAKSPEFIEIFLSSYNKGDGSITRQKESHKYRRLFFTSSKKMSEDIGELILKCGKNPSFSYDKIKTIKFTNGIYTVKHPCYRIYENNAECFYITKKEEIEFSGIVRCVEMNKNKTIYIRRNGKTMWCGNCRCTMLPEVEEYEIPKDPWTGE